MLPVLGDMRRLPVTDVPRSAANADEDDDDDEEERCAPRKCINCCSGTRPIHCDQFTTLDAVERVLMETWCFWYSPAAFSATQVTTGSLVPM